jgi:precorrin-2 dehydrogenase / sirohydrochlorin ferrochelatase
MGAMRYYPLFVDLKDKLCCVIGGGKVAERKVDALLKCFARVTVISPKLTPALEKLRRKRKILFRNSEYAGDLLRGAFLVIAATDNRLTNSNVSSACRKKGILVNVVDVPGESNFIVPSFIQKNGLIIAISTSGQAPGLAKKIRQDLSRNFLGRYAKILEQLAPARRKLKVSCPRISERKAILGSLVNSKFSRKAGSRR